MSNKNQCLTQPKSLDAAELRGALLSCYGRISRAMIVYFAIFATVSYFTFVSDWLLASERRRIENTSLQIVHVKNQIAAISSTHPDAIAILQELVIQRDHYLDYVRQALSSISETESLSTPADAQLFKTYADAVYVLIEFFSASGDRLKSWPLVDFAKLERAMTDWKTLTSGAETIDRSAHLTHLARQGATLLGTPSGSKPVVELNSADSVLAIPSVLNQALSKFDHRTACHIIEAFTASKPALGFTRRVETIEDLENLEKEVRDRRADLDTESRLQTFSMPYLGVTMRKGAILIAGLLGTTIILLYLLRQLIQLRALVRYVQRGRETSRRRARLLLTELAYLSHFAPFMQYNIRHFVPADLALGTLTRKPVVQYLLWTSLAVAIIADSFVLILFLAAPFVYLVLGHRFHQGSLALLDTTGGLILEVGAFLNLFLVLLVIIAGVIIEISIRDPKI